MNLTAPKSTSDLLELVRQDCYVAMPHANLPDVPLVYGGSGAVLLRVRVVERVLHPAKFGQAKAISQKFTPQTWIKQLSILDWA
jgi:hypothetical protein